jgi:hypothetical protein
MGEIMGETPGAIEPKANPMASVPPPTDEGKQAGAPDEPTTEKPQDPGEPSANWDEETKRYIGTLRGENAKWRKQVKTTKSELEEVKGKLNKLNETLTGKPSEDPKASLNNLQADNDVLIARNTILELAIEHNVPKTQLDYFEYLVHKGAEDLDEDDELDVSPIVEKVKTLGNTGKPANTGVPTGKTPPAARTGDVTVADFKKMGILAKSELQRTKPDLYEKLKQEALGS